MLTSAACGSPASTVSPTGPTSLGSSSLFSTDAGVDPLLAASGPGRGGRAGSGSTPDSKGRPDIDRGNGERSGSDQASANRGPDNSRVELTGFVTAVDPAGMTVTVDAAVVSVPATARVRRGSRLLTLADITIGNHVNIKGTRTLAGLVAHEVRVQPGGAGRGDDDEDGGDSELEGMMSEKSGTCPDLTFLIGTTKVTTSAATMFDEVGCAGLVGTAIVEVKGNREIDGSISALSVQVRN